MARMKVKMTQLKDPKPLFVSLVRRSANQIPFRIVKSDDEGTSMIDLTNVTKVFKQNKTETETPKPRVSAVVVMKADNMEPVVEAIKAAGYKTDAMTENEDGSVVFAQEADAEKDAQIVRLSDHMVVVCKGFEPYLSGIKNFNDQLAVDNYCLGIQDAARSLGTVIRKAVDASKTKEEAEAGAAKALADFSDYAKSLVAALPSEAWRAESGVAMVMKAAEEAAEEEGEEDEEETETIEDPPAEDPVVDTKAPVSAETPATEAPAAAPVETKVEKSDLSAMLSTITSQLGEVAKVQKSMGETLSAVVQAQNTLSTEVAGIAKKTEETEKVVKSAVVSTPPDAETPRHSRTMKSAEDEDPRTGAFDTAFIRRRK